MQGVQNKCRTRLRHPDFYQTRRGSVLFGNSWPWLPLEWTASDIIVTSSRSKWAAGKAVRAGLAARGRISEWICNRRATQPPAHFQRNPSGSAGWLLRQNREPLAPAAETIAFKSSLKLGERFHVSTAIIGWNAEQLVVRQDFLRDSKLIAQAFILAVFLRRAGGKVSTEEVLALAGKSGPSPALPAWVAEWAIQVRESVKSE
jgi:hypothetical protein